ncbi:DUF2905 domain-containing protein [Fervidibacter sacchari]
MSRAGSSPAPPTIKLLVLAVLGEFQPRVRISGTVRDMNGVEILGKFLLGFGVLLILFGGALLLFGKLGLTWKPLPGDIVIKRDNFTFVAPITTSLLLSLALTLLLWLLSMMRR